jgi:hypothetical protein
VSCSGDLSTCSSDLSTCTTDLGTAQTDLTTCNGDLGTCQTDLSQSQTDLGTCNGNLSTCNGDLGIFSTDLSTCNTDLGMAQTDLTTCNGDLGTCQTDLGQSQADLATCNGDLSTCNGDLGTCSSDLSTCNASLGTCSTDLAACQAEPKGQRVRTGQTLCYDAAGTIIACAGTGQDGDLLKGLTVSFIDNGDGTITDSRTGLMWEKISDDGSIHDKDTTYTWANAFTKIAALNGGGGFAGYTDWRLPNINELQSLVNYGTSSPAVHPPFNASCAAACTVLTCSCTQSAIYWSATTYQVIPANAWRVNFIGGGVTDTVKGPGGNYVRGVRGGS